MTDCKFQKEITAIIKEGDAKTLVSTAEKIAREMIVRTDRGSLNEGSSVSTSQIRNIFGSSKKIEMSLDKNNVAAMYNKLLLLKPYMAYAKGRFNKTVGGGRLKIPGFQLLVDCLSSAIDQAEGSYEGMRNFFNFFEAILAYHKAEGGK